MIDVCQFQEFHLIKWMEAHFFEGRSNCLKSEGSFCCMEHNINKGEDNFISKKLSKNKTLTFLLNPLF